MRVVEQLGADHVLEPAPVLSLLLQPGQVGVEVHRRVRIPAVVVGGEAAEHHLQRVWKTGVGALTLLELEAMDDGIDLRRIHAIIRHLRQRFEHHVLHLAGVLRPDVLEARAEHALLVVVLQAGAVGHRRSELGVDERLPQRRARVAEKDLCEHLHRQQPERVGARDRDPRRERLRAPRVVLARRRGIGLGQGRRPSEALHERNR